MADQREAGISWTDETWNPVVGCSIVSPACTNCYAMGMAARIERMSVGKTHYAGTTKIVNGKPVWTSRLALAPDHIVGAPLRWKRPRRVFVNSMSDLFHEDMPEVWIDRVFAVMALSPQHTFQILTKRPERMRHYLGKRAVDWSSVWPDANPPGALTISRHEQRLAMTGVGFGPFAATCGRPTFPLPNVWLGVTAEDQARADERIPSLLETPAAVRFVSAEPLLGAIDFNRIDIAAWLRHLKGGSSEPTIAPGPSDIGLHPYDPDMRFPLLAPFEHMPSGYTSPGLDWIIVGGESGPGARPTHPDWVRSIRDQCAAAGVAFHFKQWGEWIDERQATAQHMAPGDSMFDANGRPTGDRWHFYDRSDPVGGAAIRIGKSRTGRTLDGQIHDAFPEARHG